jgi:hypothetical protein
MSDQLPIEDQILVELFQAKHREGAEAKLLTEYRDHARVIARLVGQGDILHLGNGLFRITLQGQQTITNKYPALRMPG